MNFIVICDYPYTTLKTYFETKEDALNFKPSENEPADWYRRYGPNINSTRLLTTKVYPLKSYKEVETEHGTSINYVIDWDK